MMSTPPLHIAGASASTQAVALDVRKSLARRGVGFRQSPTIACQQARRPAPRCRRAGCVTKPTAVTSLMRRKAQARRREAAFGPITIAHGAVRAVSSSAPARRDRRAPPVSSHISNRRPAATRSAFHEVCRRPDLGHGQAFGLLGRSIAFAAGADIDALDGGVLGQHGCSTATPSSVASRRCSRCAPLDRREAQQRSGSAACSACARRRPRGLLLAAHASSPAIRRRGR